MDLEVEAGKTHQKGPREAQGQDLEGRPKAVPPGLGDPEEEVKGEDQGQADLGVARGEAVPRLPDWRREEVGPLLGQGSLGDLHPKGAPGQHQWDPGPPPQVGPGQPQRGKEDKEGEEGKEGLMG